MGLTEKQKEFIKNNYMTMTNKELAVSLNLSTGTIGSFLSRNNLSRDKRKNWSEEDLNFIRENSLLWSNKKFAEKFNVSESAIEQLMIRNKITRERPTHGLYYEKIDLLDGEEIKLSEYLNNKYYITSYGRIFNLNNRELAYNDSNDGYLRVSVSAEEGISVCENVHKLVALAFIPNPHNYPEIDHKDQNRGNNRVDNLRWCTHSNNVKYFASNTSTKNKMSILRNSSRKTELTKRLNEIRKICQFLEDGKSVSEISKITGENKQVIYQIKNKKKWTSISKNYNF